MFAYGGPHFLKQTVLPVWVNAFLEAGRLLFKRLL